MQNDYYDKLKNAMMDASSGTSGSGNGFYKPSDTVTYEINIA
jgi:hypothetical protein